MSERPKTIKVSEISESILKHLEAEGYTADPEMMRLGLGLTLSSLHSAMIIGAKTKEVQKAAVETCLNTFERLFGSFKHDVESAGIGHVEFETGSEPMTVKPPKVTLQ